MEQVLEKLFESVPKVRLLRLFLRNIEAYFTLLELTERTGLRRRVVVGELAKFLRLGLVEKRTARIGYAIKRKARKKGLPPQVATKYKKAAVYYVNKDFPLVFELRDLVAKASVASRSKLLSKIRGLGNVKLAILCGVFIHNGDSRTDLLLVGDKVKTGKLERFLAQLESDIGRSIQYTLMSTDEFKYRLNMYDHFVRDVLEHEHEKLINKLRV